MAKQITEVYHNIISALYGLLLTEHRFHPVLKHTHVCDLAISQVHLGSYVITFSCHSVPLHCSCKILWNALAFGGTLPQLELWVVPPTHGELNEAENHGGFSLWLNLSCLHRRGFDWGGSCLLWSYLYSKQVEFASSAYYLTYDPGILLR